VQPEPPPPAPNPALSTSGYGPHQPERLIGNQPKRPKTFHRRNGACRNINAIPQRAPTPQPPLIRAIHRGGTKSHDRMQSPLLHQPTAIFGASLDRYDVGFELERYPRATAPLIALFRPHNAQNTHRTDFHRD